jgi:hypothetical protein
MIDLNQTFFNCSLYIEGWAGMMNWEGCEKKHF